MLTLPPAHATTPISTHSPAATAKTVRAPAGNHAMASSDVLPPTSPLMSRALAPSLMDGLEPPIHHSIRRPARSTATAPWVLPGAPIADLAAFPSIQQALRAEAELDIQPGSKSFFVPSPVQPVKGTVVLLHGWSAGTWQFENMAPELAAKGYNVYVPRVEGHGFRREDGTDDPTKLPRAGEHERYRRFADRVYAEVAAIGGPVHVAGLSGGGAVALDIAARYPDVRDALLFDPFLSPGDTSANQLFGVIRFLDKLTFGLASNILKLIPVVFDGPKSDHEAWGRPGHFDFKSDQIFALSEYGRTVVDACADSNATLQFITTDKEKGLVSRDLMRDAFVASGGAERNSWYNFELEDDVDHAMIHWREIPNDDARERVRDMAYGFIEGQETYTAVPEEYRGELS